MKRRTIIGVHLWRDRTCFQEMLRGISAYSQSHDDWQLEILSPAQDYMKQIRTCRPQGVVVGEMSSARRASEIIKLVGNVVGVCSQLERLGLGSTPQVEADDEAIGELAARHFLEKGFKNFGFLGTTQVWSQRRCLGFELAIKRSGFNTNPLLFQLGPRCEKGRRLFSEMTKWLRAQPKPVAILACNDLFARDIIETCRSEGISVPDRVAILGVDNDDLDCTFSHPLLSSVAIPWQQIGYEAASMMDRLLKNEPVDPTIFRIPPLHVAERVSTDTLAISDPDLSSAVRFIRDNAHCQISVEDVLRSVAVSRRAMEASFRTLLGRSPLAEIRRVRLEIAKQLLVGTKLPMPAIAEKSGFGDPSRFTKVFHDAFGQTPSQYRLRNRTIAQNT